MPAKAPRGPRRRDPLQVGERIAAGCRQSYISGRGQGWGGDQAISDSTKAIEIEPGDAIAYYNRGVAYTGKKLHDQAIADWTKAIELKPDDADAYYNRGNAYGGKGLPDQAIADYTKAIELKPDDAEAYYNRRNAYGGKGLPDQAIADFTKATELKPDYAKAYSTAPPRMSERGSTTRLLPIPPRRLSSSRMMPTPSMAVPGNTTWLGGTPRAYPMPIRPWRWRQRMLTRTRRGRKSTRSWDSGTRRWRTTA